MPEVITYKLQCPHCQAIMDFEADEASVAELKAEDGALVECLTCKLDTEYAFRDFLSADDFEDDEDDDDESEIEELEDDEDDEDDED